ncbi:MAG: 6,7-dimethyl-8-ribityllumazine synthase [Paludibacteraceae bacterium]|jgi:6,7-dimethyl-8-ribityllumazine synthase|nr:6,7-dimethyl-8-ribityllumazine synthase [Paludibacteraceae bacterium]MDY6372792.1 6,7-dimethyl-8-ribityllumazine synthase [Bacteroidales bacterium]
MASKLQNLSSYNPNILPAKSVVAGQKYGVIVADWNSQVTFKLLEGAVSALEENGAIDITITHVPGAFELTYAANKLMQTREYNAIIVLGCVIQGDTPHFDYVCGGVTQGITALNLEKDGCPVIFGVLTTLNLEQALDRAGGKLGNKGVEGAITAIRMANMR